MDINLEKYTQELKSDGKIVLTPIKKLRWRAEKWKVYFVILWNIVSEFHDYNDIWDRLSYIAWNYYRTKQQAQAVIDLRKHVYSFGAVAMNKPYKYIDRTLLRHSESSGFENDLYSWFNYCYLPASATEEDLDERIRLLKNCLKENWYLSI